MTIKAIKWQFQNRKQLATITESVRVSYKLLSMMALNKKVLTIWLVKYIPLRAPNE